LKAELSHTREHHTWQQVTPSVLVVSQTSGWAWTAAYIDTHSKKRFYFF